MLENFFKRKLKLNVTSSIDEMCQQYYFAKLGNQTHRVQGIFSCGQKSPLGL